jgi:hypothetical protein
LANALSKSLDMVCDEMTPEQLNEAFDSMYGIRRVVFEPLDPVPFLNESLIRIHYVNVNT